MSRPFSYNDENFTIIGNVLFFHVLSTGALTSNKKLIEVPPEILEEWFQESATVTSAGVVTLTAAFKGKLIIDGTLDIECNY